MNQRPKKGKLFHLLIKPTFQLKMASLPLLLGLIIVTIYNVLINGIMKENYTILVGASPMEDAAKGQLWLELDQFRIQLVAFSLLFLVLIFFFGILLSHKVVKPLYKFKKAMEDVKGGNTKARLFFKDRDEFKELTTSFNSMMDSLVTEESEIKRGTNPNT